MRGGGSGRCGLAAIISTENRGKITLFG